MPGASRAVSTASAVRQDRPAGCPACVRVLQGEGCVLSISEPASQLYERFVQLAHLPPAIGHVVEDLREGRERQGRSAGVAQARMDLELLPREGLGLLRRRTTDLDVQILGAREVVQGVRRAAVWILAAAAGVMLCLMQPRWPVHAVLENLFSDLSVCTTPESVIRSLDALHRAGLHESTAAFYRALVYAAFHLDGRARPLLESLLLRDTGGAAVPMLLVAV